MRVLGPRLRARPRRSAAGRPEVARILLDLRREFETGRSVEFEEARSTYAHILNEDDGGDVPL